MTASNATRHSDAELPSTAAERGPAERRDQRALAEALALVRRGLEQSAPGRRESGERSKVRPRGVTPSLEPPADSALGRVVRAFGLTAFEASMLVLATGVELDSGVAKLCASCHGDVGRPFPTFALALAALDGAHWDALTPERPLRRFRLIALGDGEVLSERPLRVEERVLHALMGYDSPEPRLARRTRALSGERPLARAHEELAREVLATLASPLAPLVQLVSDTPREAVLVAARVWAAAGRRALLLGAADVPGDAAERDELARLMEREARLSNVAYIVDLANAADRGQQRAAAELATRTDAPLLVAGRDAMPVFDRAALRMGVPDAPFDQTLALWREALGDLLPDDASLRSLAAQFRLDADAVRGVAADAASRVSSGKPPAQLLWDACRVQARPRLEDLAQRLRPSAGFERLALPESQSRVLRALLGQVRHKALVQHRWGLAAQSERGNGTSAIFSGPSGTGKTMAAEAIASELGLDLFRIDLSAVVSKYIGETEENLRRVFDAAESGGAILLFDEADALFGKRTEVRDSHDRHANIEVSYLLQRMEAYGGLSILTTNLRKAIDDAFLRRVQFLVEFPFPDAALRERIWRGMFPEQMAIGALDFQKLAQLSVAGGNIRSIARNAAYLAADAGEPVSMAQLLEAARLEYGKLARALPPHEVRGWQ